MKKMILRGAVGAPLGMAISLIITIIISYCIGDGSYYAAVPEMTEWFGSEVNAVLVQYIFSALYGAVWAGSSVIWEKDNWSLLRQTLIHLAVTSVTTFPVAYLTGWMEHSIAGVTVYYAAFFGVYFMIWLFQYLPIRKRIAQMNEKLRENAE